MRQVSKIIQNCISELTFKTARSGGSGGQHANKTETKVMLEWDLDNSHYLREDEINRIKEKLEKYITVDGILQLQSENQRSQHMNKSIVTKRWKRLIRKAFHPDKKRKKTKPTKASKRKRLKNKRHRSQIKEWRKTPKRNK